MTIHLIGQERCSPVKSNSDKPSIDGYRYGKFIQDPVLNSQKISRFSRGGKCIVQRQLEEGGERMIKQDWKDSSDYDKVEEQTIMFTTTKLDYKNKEY